MSHADPAVTRTPVDAFQFKASRPKLSAIDAEGRRKFEAVFYSGDVIKDHWCWGNLVFDISTTAAKGRTGVLLQHNPEKIVGSGECVFGDDMRITGLLSAKSDAAKFVADQADEGFPWEMSHFIEPGEIDQIQAGVKVSVNGRDFTGPITVFRHNTIREVSFCANGADEQTSATVFSQGTHKGVPDMSGSNQQPTLESLQAQVAALTGQVSDVTAKFTAAEARATAAEAENKAARVTQIETMFAAQGQKFEKAEDKQAAMAPWLAMPTASFAAAVKFATPKPAPRNPNLFAADTPGEGEGEVATPVKSSLVDKAKKFAAQKQ